MSTTHISDELPRMLRGEATRDIVLAAADHLRSCPDCQQELVSAVVAHAALSSAQRFAPEIVAGHPLDEASGEDAVTEPDALPNMSGMFEQVRQEAERSRKAAARRPVRRRLIAVAAAAAVVAGGTVAVVETTSSGNAPQATRVVTLTGFDHGPLGTKAVVRIVNNRTLQVDASRLPKLDAGHSYELWLTDGARKSMLAVGFIGANNRAELTAPKVMGHYSDFEVSVQKTNQTQYSGVSVLRGAY
jgi:anti-sigma-K factor RskA